MSGLLAACFLVASLFALYEVEKLSDASSHAANGSGAIQTIRRFYAALNEYLETGDASALSHTLAPGALAFVPEQGAMGDDSGLLTYLLALRSTLPQLRFTVERIDAGDDIAIANVHTSGGTGGQTAALPNESRVSQEFFRVRDGHIVQHWTTKPDSALLHTLTVPPVPIVLTQSGHLTIAELTFTPDQHGRQAIDGPALVFVLNGRLTLVGDGSTQILDFETGATSVPGPNENPMAQTGQGILIADRVAYVRNGGPGVAEARVAMVIEDQRQSRAAIPADRPAPPLAINDIAVVESDRTTTIGAVTVRPLEFDERSIPAGTWDLDIAWAVLGPGAQLPLSREAEWSIAQAISGSASRLTQSQQTHGGLAALMNDGDKPVVALVIQLRAAHCSDDAEC